MCVYLDCLIEFLFLTKNNHDYLLNMTVNIEKTGGRSAVQ